MSNDYGIYANGKRRDYIASVRGRFRLSMQLSRVLNRCDMRVGQEPARGVGDCATQAAAIDLRGA
jgi:hypothetical protein